MKKKNRRDLEKCRDLLWNTIVENHTKPEGLNNTQMAVVMNEVHRMLEKVLARVTD